MKKEVMYVLIITIIAIVSVGSFILGTKFADSESDENKEKNPSTNIKTTYTYHTPESGTNKLVLNSENNTFEFEVNVCAGILSITGTYSKKDEQIVLSDINKNTEEFILPETIVFNEEDSNTLILEESVSCIEKGQKFEKETK